MEFPDLGEQCSLPDCRQLDFLPFKCNCCRKTFCLEHRTYADHNCSYAQAKIVPTCPVCQEPVAVPAGQTVDSAVAKHIDNNCDADLKRQKEQKRLANKCAFKGCKNNDFVFQMTRSKCNSCHLMHCLNHRNELDHSCVGPARICGADFRSEVIKTYLHERRLRQK